jgi:hypothetical protein
LTGFRTPRSNGSRFGIVGLSSHDERDVFQVKGDLAETVGTHRR